MIIGIGLDVVELERIERSWNRFGRTFAEKILTPGELESIPKNPVPFLASRFAAKEAAVKALGTGFVADIGFQTLQIRSLPSGKPVLEFLHGAKKLSERLGVEDIFITITHSRTVASAVVILQGQQVR